MPLTDFRKNVTYLIKRDKLQVWEMSNTRRYMNQATAPYGFRFMGTHTDRKTIKLDRKKGDRKDPFWEMVFEALKDGIEPDPAYTDAPAQFTPSGALIQFPVDNTKVKA